MAPFIVLIVAWTGLCLAGWFGFGRVASWRATGRIALAVMFVFTGTTHFTSMRTDYLAMIPDALPASMGIIYVTGALEILGAIGLLLPRIRPFAGVCLALLLIVIFPANIYAWVADIPFNGRPPTSLWIRAPIQVSFLVVLWFTAIRSGRDAS